MRGKVLRGDPRRAGRPTTCSLSSTSRPLPAVANGQATKIFLPTEATALLGTLGGMAEMLMTAPKVSSNGSSPHRDTESSSS